MSDYQLPAWYQPRPLNWDVCRACGGSTAPLPAVPFATLRTPCTCPRPVRRKRRTG